MQNQSNIALSYLFTSNVLNEFFYNQYSKHLVKVFNEFNMLDKKSKDYKEFVKETKEDCLDDGWF